ncbi:MAG: hypothetical protein WC356_03240 [Candidatus Micrarchaeia archaeon]|jgi:hypothetical protein
MKNLQHQQEGISELLRVSNVFERIKLFDSSILETDLKPKGKVIISDLWFFNFNKRRLYKKELKIHQTIDFPSVGNKIINQFFSEIDSMYLLHNKDKIYQNNDTFYIPSKGEKAILFLILKYPNIWENSKQILKSLLQKKDIDFNNYSEEQIASALIIINILSFGLSGISSNINLKMEMNNRLIDSKKYNETLRFLYLYQSNILEDFVEYIKP